MTTTARAPVSLAHDDTGGTGTPLVLIHGFPLDRTIWSAQRDALAAIARVITVDLPGCGATPPRGGIIAMDDLAGDLAATLDALGIARAALAGHSIGGYVALAFARRHPARLSGLALVASHFAPDTEKIRALRDPLADRVEREGMGPALDYYLQRYFAPAVYEQWPELIATTRELMSQLDRQAAAAMIRGMARRPDSRATAAALTVPLLVLGGELDDYITPADLRADAALAPEAIVAILEGVGHMPMLESPVRTGEALAAWLGRVRA